MIQSGTGTAMRPRSRDNALNRSGNIGNCLPMHDRVFGPGQHHSFRLEIHILNRFLICNQTHQKRSVRSSRVTLKSPTNHGYIWHLLDDCTLMHARISLSQFTQMRGDHEFFAFFLHSLIPASLMVQMFEMPRLTAGM